MKKEIRSDKQPVTTRRAKRGIARADCVPAAKRRPARKANETYPLRLTRPERECLIQSTRLKRKIKERLHQAGEDPTAVAVNLKELEYLNDEVGRAALHAFRPDHQRLIAVLRRIDLLLDEVSGDQVPMAPEDSEKGPAIYQFLIGLIDIEPAIWRRIQVLNCTLADLHEFIQAAFGWENCHMHQFEIDGERWGPVDPDGMDFGIEWRDEAEITLGRLVAGARRKRRWIYEYDFGDGWRHEIVFEGRLTGDRKSKYPQCLEGKRASPPEDCGGPWGYYDICDALVDPNHERHEELLDWIGSYDPEAFDAKQATREMRKVR